MGMGVGAGMGVGVVMETIMSEEKRAAMSEGKSEDRGEDNLTRRRREK